MNNINFGILPDLIGHLGTVWKICFSPVAKIIASCSSDNSIKLWNTESRKLIT